ncbi:hypothetical protein ACFLU1_02415 [Chloroflexota bacterium]
MRSKTIDIIVNSILVTGLMILVFSISTSYGQATPKFYPATGSNVTNTNLSPTVEYRVLESRTIQYVEKPVTVMEYVEQVKRAPIELRNFYNLEELEQWLWEAGMKTNTVYFQSPNNTIDCDDYAIALQQRALTDGYLMSLEITETSEYNGLFKNIELAPHSLHAINLVIIDNDAYYIEPQTSEVVFAVHLD